MTAAVEVTRTAETSATFGNVAVLRGSMMFLVGRVVAMGVAMLTQVIIVRHLSKDSFGAFAFALALAALLQSVLPLGLDRADTRFLTLHDDDKQPGRILGLVLTELLVVLGTGTLALVAVAVLGTSRLSGTLPPIVFLAVLAVAPLMALDGLVLNVFAVFAKPQAVFLRRYVLDPGLRLAVVLLLVLHGMRVALLAYGFLIVGVLGSVLYLCLLVRLLRTVVRRSGVPVRFQWPGRSLFTFAAPLLVGAVMYAAATSIPTIMLKFLGSAAAVAEVRAVQQVAALILVVPTVFATLFLPRAARLFHRGEAEALRAHYWSTALWVAVLAFPVMILLVAFPHQVTLTLFGDRYREAAFPLAVMALAFYANAAVGLNGSLLQVAGRVKSLTLANLAGLVVAVGAGWLLIPSNGADGAAVAIALALAIPQVFKQASLHWLGVGGAHPTAWRLWITSTALLGSCCLLSSRLDPGILPALGISLAAWAVLVYVTRNDLVLSEVVPVAMLRRRLPFGAASGPGQNVGASVDPLGSGEAADDDARLPGSWQCVDWRFLLQSPELGRVRVVGSQTERAALITMGEVVVDPADPMPVDTWIEPSRDCDASRLAQVRVGLVSGGLVKIAVMGRPPGTLLRGRLRPLPAWRRHLHRAGFTPVEIQVALPNLARTSAFVSLSNPVALQFALRRQPVRPLSRVLGRFAALLVGLGLRAVVCRQGVVLARLPADGGRPDGTAAGS